MTKLSEETKQEMLALVRRFKRENFLPTVVHKGVTPSESNVIFGIYMAIKHKVDPIHPRDLAKWLQLTPSALSQTLKMLEEKGCVKRERTSGDSRAVSLGLTEEGLSVANDIFSARDEFMNALAEYIGEEDIRHIINTCNKVFEFVNEKKEAGSISHGSATGFHHSSCLVCEDESSCENTVVNEIGNTKEEITCE